MPYNEVVRLFYLFKRKGGNNGTKEQFKLEGKRAFHPDKNPLVLNPYPKSNGVSVHDLWLEGWRETAIEHEQGNHFLSYQHAQYKQMDLGIEEQENMFMDNSIFLNHVQCNFFEEYFAHKTKETSCWQLARKKDDFRFDGYVCQDCIVYKYAKPDDEFNKQQIKKILHRRKILRAAPIIKEIIKWPSL